MKKPNLLLAALVQTILYITFCIVYRGLFIAGIMESGIMRFAHLFAGVFMYITGIDAAIAVDRKIFDRPKGISPLKRRSLTSPSRFLWPSSRLHASCLSANVV